MDTSSQIRTRFLILSDTHGDEYPHLTALKALGPMDVAIHCGDLTEEPKLEEFQAALDLLEEIDAPLKLVIGGNHDFTLDEPAFRRILDEAGTLDKSLVHREFGQMGEARRLLESHSPGIMLLDEGTHEFSLDNGAHLTVYASPYTPSKQGNWGFQYKPEEGHEWAIKEGTDIAITHGPPHGILDRTEAKERAGCSNLFATIARARPRLHCFGHIHEGWGAKLVGWRERVEAAPSHFNAIDNSKSTVIESLAGTKAGRFDTPDVIEEKMEKKERYRSQGAVMVSLVTLGAMSLEAGRSHQAETLSVNASLQGPSEADPQFPWIVDLDLCRAQTGTSGG